MIKAYSSSLPAIINIDSKYLTGSENKLKFIAGPTRLNPGPTLPIQARTLENDVKKSKPSRETKSVHKNTSSMCKKSILVTELTVSMLAVLSFILILMIAFG